MPTCILGLDPGLQVTGYAVLEHRSTGLQVCEAGVVRGNGPGKTDMAKRLAVLYRGITEVLDQFQPQSVAIEQLYAHYDHPRTAILMGHARGVLLLAAGERDIPLTSYSATRIKKTITGHGRASKSQMQHSIMRELKLSKLPEPADVADALAVALCHSYAAKMAALKELR